VLPDLRDTDRLAGKDRAQIDFALLVADAAAGRDDRGPIGKRILELANAAIRPRRAEVGIETRAEVGIETRSVGSLRPAGSRTGVASPAVSSGGPPTN
jgi:hypothetical protein